MEGTFINLRIINKRFSFIPHGLLMFLNSKTNDGELWKKKHPSVSILTYILCCIFSCIYYVDFNAIISIILIITLKS